MSDDWKNEMWYRLELGEDGMVAALKRKDYSPEKVKAVLELNQEQAHQLDTLLAQYAWAAQDKIEQLDRELARQEQDNIAVDLTLVEDYDAS